MFTELLSDTGETSEYAKQVVKQTSDFMQKSPQEIVIESALSKRKPLEASTLEATDSTGEEDEKVVDEKTSISKVH